MSTFEDEHGVANNHEEEEEVFADAIEVIEPVENNSEPEISKLFEEARNKIAKVNEDAEKLKKQIVIELAQALEGKIETDTICMEIIYELRGRVSPTTIRECLDEKYKKKAKSENAKKRMNVRHPKQEEPDSANLATPPLLNEEEEDRKKAVMIGADGHTLIQEYDDGDDEGDEDDNGQPMTTPNTNSRVIADTTSVTTTELTSQQQHTKGQENPFIKEEECQGCKDKSLRIVELEEDLNKSNQFITADMGSASDAPITDTTASFTQNDELATPYGDKETLQFEFSKTFREIRQYMTPLHSKIGDNGKVWFSGIMDKKTGTVISSKLGRASLGH
ncbi:MAG: hypothetical protein M3162_02510 [Thermoproteota archaeon]|nr:hypothetical protein [Thermoproteota archaeon]